MRFRKLEVTEINVRKCLLCNTCPAIEACSTKAISRLDPDEPPYINLEYCLGCGKCVKVCPASAISVRS